MKTLTIKFSENNNTSYIECNGLSINEAIKILNDFKSIDNKSKDIIGVKFLDSADKIPVRLYNTMNRHLNDLFGLDRIDDLYIDDFRNITKKDLLKCRDIGKRTLTDLDSILAKYNVVLK